MHGTLELVERFKAVSTSEFQQNMVMSDSYDMIYLKAPIGSDEFVAQWLKIKLSKLKNIIAAISLVPYKHEAFTLLKSCARECRVMYLIRVLPPRQLGNFMKGFDGALNREFEKL